ncbi:MAG: 16S rRNA (cytidine(1402)-2'-O)-methyltransferase [Rhodobacteraceae bacterium]|nr:16S rRNA (cytidine(1402)-2'-O)-methyltransferase [Paracoccaceae bacterium]
MAAPSEADALKPGLYLVATPIGAARDITLRAIDILAGADILAAEDTRSLRRLMEIHGIPLRGRRIVAYHDHNGSAVRPKLLAALAEGRSVAYASEAGTPLIADPGYDLAREARAAGHDVRAAPGASALLAALAVAGLPTDRFLFAGFPPNRRGRRRDWLAEMKGIRATLVFYEAPGRIRETLADCVSCFGGTRPAAVARELTKRFEEVTRGSLGELAALWAEREARGEFVVLVGWKEDRAVPDVEAALRAALESMPVSEAAARVAAELHLPRRQVYQAALALGRGR